TETWIVDWPTSLLPAYRHSIWTFERLRFPWVRFGLASTPPLLSENSHRTASVDINTSQQSSSHLICTFNNNIRHYIHTALFNSPTIKMSEYSSDIQVVDLGRD